MKDVLIVFARYPDVGKCKTRLISALGPKGATDLHESMTRFTLSWAANLSQDSGVAVQVRFDGGDCEAMQLRFGDGFEYHRQCSGDLGCKLRHAVQHCTDQHCTVRHCTDRHGTVQQAAFRHSVVENGAMQRTVVQQAAIQPTSIDRIAGESVTKVVVVGTDCPELSAEAVCEAFAALDDHDVCLAPASDGGYTLLGMRLESDLLPQVDDALFGDISWGTENVLIETIEGLAATGVSVCILPTLSDVDTADDLAVWERARAGKVAPRPKLSVIVPTLGSEQQLSEVIALTARESAVETIVVAAGDSASTLLTVARNAARHKVRFIRGPANRSAQMNLGAAQAKADTLLFLHADTLLPSNFLRATETCLANKNTVGGAFHLRIDSRRSAARLVEWGVRMRSTWLSLPYGDQALFVRKSAFEQVGGFRNHPIMEDFEFVRRLGEIGSIRICDSAATTSARRWHRLGFFKTTLINQLVIAGYRMGVSPERLARFYCVD